MGTKMGSSQSAGTLCTPLGTRTLDTLIKSWRQCIIMQKGVCGLHIPFIIGMSRDFYASQEEKECLEEI